MTLDTRNPHSVRKSRECIDCGAETWKPGAHKCFKCLSSKDYKSVVHRTNYPPRKGATGRCIACEGQSWRRPENEPCKCGELYAEENWRCE